MNQEDARIAEKIIKYDGTPQALECFKQHCDQLTDYSYWFMLSTLWVSGLDKENIAVWRELFKSRRPNKQVSLMKPDEFKAYRSLPSKVIVYRAVKACAPEGIAYTLDINVAKEFALRKGADQICEYRVKKRDILALFLRRQEQEVIILDPSVLKLKATIDVIIAEDKGA